MPRNDLYWVFFARVAVDFVAGFTEVVDLDVTVFAASQKPVAIDRVPSDAANHVVRCSNFIPAFTAGSRVPYFDRLIFASGDNER